MNGEKRAKILIVDDNPGDLDFLVRYLKESGFKIFVVSSGEKAIQELEHILPDIILLGIMMGPGIDGFETYQCMRKNRAVKNIPIVFMSALSDRLNKIKAFYMGAVDYITKPFQQEEVLARIAVHLAIQRQKNEMAQINTKLFKLSNRLLKSNTLLSESKAEEDRFFSVAAHHMKHMLFSLMGASEMLTDSVAASDCKHVGELAQSVHAYAKNTYKILEEVLCRSKLQIGEIDFQPEDIDLYEIVSRNISLLTANAREKNIHILQTVEKRTFVYADSDMTDIIFSNLIFNVIKFGSEGNKVEIAARRLSAMPSSGENEESGFVEISVSDMGIHTHDEHPEKWFHADKTDKTDRKYENAWNDGDKSATNDLLLCRELVEKNNGNIRVESEGGKGIVFRLCLPSPGGRLPKSLEFRRG